MSDLRVTVQVGGLGMLRTSAALALVFSAAAGLPAIAQTTSGPAPTEAPAEEPQGQTARDDDSAERDRVYVLGRRVVSSVATVDVEGRPAGCEHHRWRDAAGAGR